MIVVMPIDSHKKIKQILIHSYTFHCANKSEFLDFDLITTKLCHNTFFIENEIVMYIVIGDVHTLLYLAYNPQQCSKKFNEYSPMLFLKTLSTAYVISFRYTYINIDRR